MFRSHAGLSTLGSEGRNARNGVLTTRLRASEKHVRRLAKNWLAWLSSAVAWRAAMSCASSHSTSSLPLQAMVPRNQQQQHAFGKLRNPSKECLAHKPLRDLDAKIRRLFERVYAELDAEHVITEALSRDRERGLFSISNRVRRTKTTYTPAWVPAPSRVHWGIRPGPHSHITLSPQCSGGATKCGARGPALRKLISAEVEQIKTCGQSFQDQRVPAGLGEQPEEADRLAAHMAVLAEQHISLNSFFFN